MRHLNGEVTEPQMTCGHFGSESSKTIAASGDVQEEPCHSCMAASELLRNFSRARVRVGPIEFSAMPKPTAISW